MAKPPPICLALILCDAIWRDSATGKRTLLGTFSAINAKAFPVSHEHTAVYAALTDGYGKTQIELRLTDPDDDDRPLVSATGEVEFENPRAVVDLDFHFQRIAFPHPGEYRFQLWANDSLLLERRMLVQSGPPPATHHDR